MTVADLFKLAPVPRDAEILFVGPGLREMTKELPGSSRSVGVAEVGATVLPVEAALTDRSLSDGEKRYVLLVS
jgi:hypothetical protein